MTIELTKYDLQHALKFIRNGIDNKPSVPILQHVLLTATEGKVTLRGTNLDLDMQTSIATLTGEPESMLVPLKSLTLACEGKGDKVSMELNGAFVNLKCGKAKFKKETFAVKEYPEPRNDGFTELGSIKGSILADVFAVNVAATLEESRYALQCINLVQNSNLTGLAGDGHLLARSIVASELQPFNALIFAPHVAKLRTVLTDELYALAISEKDLRLTNTVNQDQITIRLGSGQFPNMDVIFNQTSSARYIPVTDAMGEIARLGVTFFGNAKADNKIVLDSNSATVTGIDGKDEMVIDSDEIKALECGKKAFNAILLGKAFSWMGATLHAAIAGDMIALKSSTDNNVAQESVLMGMRI